MPSEINRGKLLSPRKLNKSDRKNKYRNKSVLPSSFPAKNKIPSLLSLKIENPFLSAKPPSLLSLVIPNPVVAQNNNMSKTKFKKRYKNFLPPPTNSGLNLYRDQLSQTWGPSVTHPKPSSSYKFARRAELSGAGGGHPSFHHTPLYCSSMAPTNSVHHSTPISPRSKTNLSTPNTLPLTTRCYCPSFCVSPRTSTVSGGGSHMESADII